MVTHKASEDNRVRLVVSNGVATRKDKGAPPPDPPTRRSARNAACQKSIHSFRIQGCQIHYICEPMLARNQAQKGSQPSACIFDHPIYPESSGY